VISARNFVCRHWILRIRNKIRYGLRHVYSSSSCAKTLARKTIQALEIHQLRTAGSLNHSLESRLATGITRILRCITVWREKQTISHRFSDNITGLSGKFRGFIPTACKTTVHIRIKKHAEKSPAAGKIRLPIGIHDDETSFRMVRMTRHSIDSRHLRDDADPKIGLRPATSAVNLQDLDRTIEVNSGGRSLRVNRHSVFLQWFSRFESKRFPHCCGRKGFRRMEVHCSSRCQTSPDRVIFKQKLTSSVLRQDRPITRRD